VLGATGRDWKIKSKSCVASMKQRGIEGFKAKILDFVSLHRGHSFLLFALALKPLSIRAEHWSLTGDKSRWGTAWMRLGSAGTSM
jgi:hypothetical protein